MAIKINQPFMINGQITVNGSPPPDSVTAVTVMYWNVADFTKADPTGEWLCTVTNPNTGEWEYNVPANVVNQAGTWRTEVNATINGLTFPAESGTIEVKLRGR